VGKQIKPPNVPQTRYFESFWSDLAHKLYSDSWEVKTRDQLDGISLKFEFDVNYLQTIMKHAKTNVRKIADGGAFDKFRKKIF
jgi:hypothetical protein